MNTPVVSVLTPTYKGERFLARAIESVLAQTYPHIELIVVNDGSPDGCAGIARRYTNDTRVTYVEQRNAGVAAARNTALRHATGTYIGLCDQDDEWRNDKAETQVRFLESNPDVGLVHSDVDYIDESGRLLPHDPSFPAAVQGWAFGRLYVGNPIMTVTAMFRMSLITEVGAFDPTIHYSDDYDLWLRIAARYPIGYIAEPLARYRWHAENKTHDHIAIRKSTLQVLRKAERTSAAACSAVNPAEKRERRFRLYRAIASYGWEDGAPLTALKFSALAAGTAPMLAVRSALPAQLRNRGRWYWSQIKRRFL